MNYNFFTSSKYCAILIGCCRHLSGSAVVVSEIDRCLNAYAAIGCKFSRNQNSHIFPVAKNIILKQYLSPAKRGCVNAILERADDNGFIVKAFDKNYLIKTHEVLLAIKCFAGLYFAQIKPLFSIFSAVASDCSQGGRSLPKSPKICICKIFCIKTSNFAACLSGCFKKDVNKSIFFKNKEFVRNRIKISLLDVVDSLVKRVFKKEFLNFKFPSLGFHFIYDTVLPYTYNNHLD